VCEESVGKVEARSGHFQEIYRRFIEKNVSAYSLMTILNECVDDEGFSDVVVLNFRGTDSEPLQRKTYYSYNAR
jgi:hypothetical protein